MTRNAEHISKALAHARAIRERILDARAATIGTDDVPASSISDASGLVDQLERVAYQTRLLALNLTIEAARGEIESGQFADAATEVRDLAQQNSDLIASLGSALGASGGVPRDDVLLDAALSALTAEVDGLSHVLAEMASDAPTSEENDDGPVTLEPVDLSSF